MKFCFFLNQGGEGLKQLQVLARSLMRCCILARTILSLIWMRTRVFYPYVNASIWGNLHYALIYFLPILFKDLLSRGCCLRPAPSPALIISSLRGSQSNPVYQFQSQPLARNTIRSLFSDWIGVHLIKDFVHCMGKNIKNKKIMGNRKQNTPENLTDQIKY